MTQSFNSLQRGKVHGYWVSVDHINESVSETLFWGNDPLFSRIFKGEDPFSITKCDFKGIPFEDAEKHFMSCYNAYLLEKGEIDELLTEEEIDYELAIRHANEIRNALRELESTIPFDSILCGIVEIFSSLQKEEVHLKLKVGYTEEDLAQFCKALDVNYDAGFGGQEVYGVIWLKDGTWITREEYDGSEWWDHHTVPDIPDVLKG